MPSVQDIVNLIAIGGAIFFIVRYIVKSEIHPLGKRVYSLEKVVANIDKKLDQLLDVSVKKPVIVPDSPVSLNQYGIEIAEKSNADALMEKYGPNVAVTKDMNPYTIQQKCFDYAQSDLYQQMKT